MLEIRKSIWLSAGFMRIWTVWWEFRRLISNLVRGMRLCLFNSRIAICRGLCKEGSVMEDFIIILKVVCLTALVWAIINLNNNYNYSNSNSRNRYSLIRLWLLLLGLILRRGRWSRVVLLLSVLRCRILSVINLKTKIMRWG